MILSSIFKVQNSVHKRQGFAFMGLLLSILVAMIAFGTAYYTLGPTLALSFAKKTMERGEKLRLAVNAYQKDHGGANPGALQDLVNPTNPACSMDSNTSSPTYRQFYGWCGPYVNQSISEDSDAYRKDGWGSDFVLEATVIRSCGMNRSCGDSDDILF